ncbi:recombinase family protein [Saccharopolyspora sp. HNM0986]|uniref:recombinase family protein n=1 Tax=Saccharopolyspora galaxeae TaxID=2781241 RepID=UPI001F462396|nr:recombinase family protein [Saccharopolyspora sp. HNM0986]MBK0869888.1 recombinase family protein [Saccharopolyspora sp. HNM0986]
MLREVEAAGGPLCGGFRIPPPAAVWGAELSALKNPDRGWNAVVVGEGTRCWFGNQFSLIAPNVVPCPSARPPEQNRHRLADGWQGSTVRALLENPRYTGYAFFGRWTRQEMLIDPDDVAAEVRSASADRVSTAS